MTLSNQNELLRSAYAIALRKGKDTNWDALTANLQKQLLIEAGVPDNTDEQIILRATCTARTYKLVEEEQNEGVGCGMKQGCPDRVFDDSKTDCQECADDVNAALAIENDEEHEV